MIEKCKGMNHVLLLFTWLYLAKRSLLQGAPVLIYTQYNTLSTSSIRVIKTKKKKFKELIKTCPLANPTERSAMKLSSVSPLLWLTITPHPAAFESSAALMDSVTVPIWLTCSQVHIDKPIEAWIWYYFNFCHHFFEQGIREGKEHQKEYII